MAAWLEAMDAVLWGHGLVAMILMMGTFCLTYGHFLPIRSLRALRRQGRSGGHGQTPFQACMTSLAAAMGTGNIVGVTAALAAGGPGAIFWMWAAAVPGMGLIYAENVLAARYRRGETAGAVAYLRWGLGSRGMAAGFAVCCVAASFGMGDMVQSRAMAGTLAAAYGVPPLVTGLAAAAVTAVVVFGGAGRTGRFTAHVMPLVTLVYLLAAAVVTARGTVPLGDVLHTIVTDALDFRAAAGGIGGAALAVGVRRGVFSNEAGLGSSGLLHADADAASPAFLGACAMLEVAADTLVCCTATALAVLTSGVPVGDSAETVYAAFRTGLGGAADWLLPPVIAVFALCTLVGWCHCGSHALRGLTGGRGLGVYRAAFCLAAVIGACTGESLVWTLADIANACMAWINLPGILLLWPKTARQTP